MRRVSVWLDEEEYDKLRREAFEGKTSMSALLKVRWSSPGLRAKGIRLPQTQDTGEVERLLKGPSPEEGAIVREGVRRAVTEFGPAFERLGDQPRDRTTRPAHVRGRGMTQASPATPAFGETWDEVERAKVEKDPESYFAFPKSGKRPK